MSLSHEKRAARDEFVLGHWGQMSDAEMADKYGCTPQAIASCRWRLKLVRRQAIQIGVLAKSGTAANPTGWDLPRGMTKAEKKWAKENWWTDPEAKLLWIHDRDRIRRQG